MRGDQAELLVHAAPRTGLLAPQSVSALPRRTYVAGLRPDLQACLGGADRTVRHPGSKDTDMSKGIKDTTAASQPKTSKKARLEAMLRWPRGGSQKRLEKGFGWQP